jgi:hypothetical protein
MARPGGTVGLAAAALRFRATKRRIVPCGRVIVPGTKRPPFGTALGPKRLGHLRQLDDHALACERRAQPVPPRERQCGFLELLQRTVRVHRIVMEEQEALHAHGLRESDGIRRRARSVHRFLCL